MGLVPLAWLAGLALCGRYRDPAYWWVAAAFGVSWVADTAAHWGDPWMISAVYPLTQAAIVGAVLASREEARAFGIVLIVAGLLSILLFQAVDGSERFLRTVAWAGVVGIVWPLPLGRLRLALLVAFGGGWAAWMVYTTAPTWTTWGLYQAVRAVSLGLFCWAAWRPQPVLKVERAHG